MRNGSLEMNARTDAGSRCRLVLACLAAALAAAAMAAPASASAGDTVWICKPGQADDLCAGTIDGETFPPPGEQPQPLGYSRPEDPPVDCLYLYPTQSEQPGPNANLDKDPPIRRVVVQQARMFSSVCDVYAPMYRQVTLNGNQTTLNESVETAYRSARSGFRDYLRNYNDGRGFILLGHSQGAAHVARLIAEMVDARPGLRERFVGAIAPGANISVPIGEDVGGLFDNVPACTEVGQHGCVIAYSTFNDVPGATAPFARLDFGYWIYPGPRPNPDSFEVMCTNPALLDGGDGTLEPLVNFDYLFDVPDAETASPWRGMPDYYRVDCERQGGAHWLNLSKVGLPGDARPDLGATVADGSNYHVPEVNLAEGNLLRIARLQADSFRADARAKLQALRTSLSGLRARRARHRAKLRRLRAKIERSAAGARRDLRRKARAVRGKLAAERKEIGSLKERISELEQRLG
ncbi:MAG: DUF3089 domain-containing protein [Acidobacteria bacterium]|nr:MAG: DUF3089 domain-containing protein [Acidobacteriota bacterium]MCL4286627.1 DUF3089 domain-containing protein [Thermoleophilia bacterium]GIK77419.1 MAG: hypothetical protein BroJett022_11090 [Actinomycetes bacterium]